MKRMEREIPSGGGLMDERMSAEADVERARHSSEQGLLEASRVGTRAAKRLVTPALIGVGLAGGALLLLALVRLARRPADGALIRIVIETPRSPKRMLPIVGGAVARWLFERQLRGRGPLGALVSALSEPALPSERGATSLQTARSIGHYQS